MGVLLKRGDVTAQLARYLAQREAVKRVVAEFETRPSVEAWGRVGEAERAMEREWQEYRRLALAIDWWPGKRETKKAPKAA